MASSCGIVRGPGRRHRRDDSACAVRLSGHPGGELDGPIAGEHHMRVRVHPARQHRAATHVDRGVRGRRGRCGTDPTDDAVLQNHRGTAHPSDQPGAGRRIVRHQLRDSLDQHGFRVRHRLRRHQPLPPRPLPHRPLPGLEPARVTARPARSRRPAAAPDPRTSHGSPTEPAPHPRPPRVWTSAAEAHITSCPGSAPAVRALSVRIATRSAGAPTASRPPGEPIAACDSRVAMSSNLAGENTPR